MEYDSLSLLGFSEEELNRFTRRFNIRPAFDKEYRKFFESISKSDPQPSLNSSIRKEDGSFLIEVALAGYDSSNIDVSTEGENLIIEAKKSSSKERENELIYEGMLTSDFQTAIVIPSKFDLSKIKVTLSNGLLSIVIPPSESRKKKKVSISTGEPEKPTKIGNLSDAEIIDMVTKTIDDLEKTKKLSKEEFLRQFYSDPKKKSKKEIEEENRRLRAEKPKDCLAERGKKEENKKKAEEEKILRDKAHKKFLKEYEEIKRGFCPNKGIIEGTLFPFFFL